MEGVNYQGLKAFIQSFQKNFQKICNLLGTFLGIFEVVLPKKKYLKCISIRNSSYISFPQKFHQRLHFDYFFSIFSPYPTRPLTFWAIIPSKIRDLLKIWKMCNYARSFYTTIFNLVCKQISSAAQVDIVLGFGVIFRICDCSIMIIMTKYLFLRIFGDLKDIVCS